MEVVANFIANPFAAVSGAYGGLVAKEPFVGAMSGSVRVAVTGDGAFSAVLRFGAETVRFAGAFDSKGRFTGQIVRTGKPPLQLVLALDVTGGSGGLTGLISDGTTTAAINADRVLSPSPQRGRYTAVLVGTFSGQIHLGAGVGKVSFGGVLLPKTGVGRGQVHFSSGIGEVILGAP